MYSDESSDIEDRSKNKTVIRPEDLIDRPSLQDISESNDSSDSDDLEQLMAENNQQNKLKIKPA